MIGTAIMVLSAILFCIGVVLYNSTPPKTAAPSMPAKEAKFEQPYVYVHCGDCRPVRHCSGCHAGK